MKADGPATLGPLVIPVSAGAVDRQNTFAYGGGIFGAVQTELATFTIQPMDVCVDPQTQHQTALASR